MDRFADLLLPAATMCPFVALYFSGVLVRIRRENQRRPLNRRARFSLAHAGEALPGLFETVVLLAAIFGVVFKSSEGGQQFQQLGMFASAGFISFRGGYTYQESLLGLKHPPAAIGADPA